MILPQGTWDTHCHVFPNGFEAAPGKALPPGGGSLEDYRSLCARLGIAHPVFVQSNAYALDNSALVATLEAWGQGASGVASVAVGTPDEELARLHEAGVRGARIMDLGGGAVPLADAPAVAAMVAPFGWTPILQFDGSDILEHEAMLRTLRDPYVIDHVGKFLGRWPTAPEIDALRRLMDEGAHVKLCAAYEFSHTGAPDFEDVAAIARTLVDHAPERVVWGSNWPHILKAPNDEPDDEAMARTALSWVPESARQAIFVDTPRKLFGA